MIDLRDHPVTQALGGSEFAYFTTPSTECQKLYETIDASSQLWLNGERNQSVALFYQVYSPQASQEEIELVQAYLDPSLSVKIAERDSGISALVFGSILEDVPASSNGTASLEKRSLPWVLSKAHKIGRRFVLDLAHAYAVGYFGTYVNGCCPRSDCYNGACMSWAVDIPKFYSANGAGYVNDLVSKYPQAAELSAHAWDRWGSRGTVCVSNRPDGCTNHG